VCTSFTTNVNDCEEKSLFIEWTFEEALFSLHFQQTLSPARVLSLFSNSSVHHLFSNTIVETIKFVFH
jgi:hypothetical protein